MLQKNILVVGPAGSGKTYLTDHLNKQGINAIDADNIPDLGKWVDKKGQPVLFLKDASKEWFDQHDYIWDLNVLRDYMAQHKPIIVFGLSSNCFEATPFFDKRFYLHATPDLLQKRLSSADRVNPMGKDAQQTQAILNTLQVIEENAEKHHFQRIDASLSPQAIQEILLK
jgi:adenylate kinase family enzyme